MAIMDTVCRLYLAVLSLYHVVSGILSYFFPNFAMSFYKALYACDPVERRHLALILKPWGALAVCAGICGLFAAADPARYRGVVVALAVLLAARIGYRLACRKKLQEISGIPARRNLISTAVILAGLLILLSWLVIGRPRP